MVIDRHWNRLGRSLDPDDFTDAQTIAAVERITRGNFRLLECLIPQITCVLKINQLEIITADVIEAAASVLVIGNLRQRATTKHRQRAPNSTRHFERTLTLPVVPVVPVLQSMRRLISQGL
ncbi:hypothetical protein ABIB51_004425 [Arthrobacter sp. UYCu712]